MALSQTGYGPPGKYLFHVKQHAGNVTQVQLSHDQMPQLATKGHNPSLKGGLVASEGQGHTLQLGCMLKFHSANVLLHAHVVRMF